MFCRSYEVRKVEAKLGKNIRLQRDQSLLKSDPVDKLAMPPTCHASPLVCCLNLLVTSSQNDTNGLSPRGVILYICGRRCIASSRPYGRSSNPDARRRATPSKGTAGAQCARACRVCGAIRRSCVCDRTRRSLSEPEHARGPSRGPPYRDRDWPARNDHRAEPLGVLTNSAPAAASPTKPIITLTGMTHEGR